MINRTMWYSALCAFEDGALSACIVTVLAFLGEITPALQSQSAFHGFSWHGAFAALELGIAAGVAKGLYEGVTVLQNTLKGLLQMGEANTQSGPPQRRATDAQAQAIEAAPTGVVVDTPQPDPTPTVVETAPTTVAPPTPEAHFTIPWMTVFTAALMFLTSGAGAISVGLGGGKKLNISVQSVSGVPVSHFNLLEAFELAAAIFASGQTGALTLRLGSGEYNVTLQEVQAAA